MKKFFSILVTFCMVFSMVPLTASAAEMIASGTCGDNLSWGLTADGTLTISGIGYMDEHYDADANLVYCPWGTLKDQVRAVVVKPGVRSIGSAAFYRHPNLVCVSLPDGLERIGWSAFYECTSLTSVSLPQGLLHIDDFAFSYCEALPTLSIPDGVLTIGKEALYNCYSLTSLDVPDSVTAIGDYAFMGCLALTTMNIPDSLSRIGNYTYACCGITSAVIPEGVKEIGEYAFWGCEQMEKLTIPDTVTRIGSNAFRACVGLTSVSIPDSVAVIESEAFAICEGLEEIHLGNQVASIGTQAFYDCISLRSVTLPASLTYLADHAFEWCPSLKTVKFLGSAPEVGEEPFMPYMNIAFFYPANDASWTDAELQKYGENKTWTGYHDVCSEHHYEAAVKEPTCQIRGCTVYTCTICGDSYVDNYTDPVDHSYEDGHCKWCGIQASPMSGICGDNLTWVLTEDGVLTISGTGAMYDYEYMGAPWCADLEDIRQIVIQDGATGIGTNAFREAVNLTGVSLSDTITQIGNFAFYGDVRLADMELPANLESLGQEAFAHSALTAVELPGSLTFIDACAFYSCTSLTDVVIHSGDAPSLMFGNSPFRGCTALEKIHVDEGHFALLDIDGVLYGYFNEGYELLQYPLGRKDPTLTIEEGTLIINMLAVEAAPYLEEVTIPASVSEIFTFAFSGSTNLKTIRFLGDAPVIGDYAFNAVTADCCYPAGNATWTDDVMQSYGGELTWKPDAVQVPTVKWSSISTSLGGNIAMNFYVELSEDLVADPDAYIQFSFAGRTLKVALSEGKPSQKNGVTVYQFSCPITSKNMTDEITAQVYNASGAVGDPKSMSVDTYCNWVIANFKDEKTVNLMKAMLNYGASAQKLFKYRTDDLANASLAEADKVFGAVDASAYKHSVVGGEEGIIAKSMTLLLDSETTVRVYFELTGDKTIDQYTFTVDGVEVQPTFKDGKYYIERPNISAHRLDDMHIFTCGGITVTYGGLSYVNQVMTYYTEGTTFEMASALYAYSKAAEAYIG